MSSIRPLYIAIKRFNHTNYICQCSWKKEVVANTRVILDLRQKSNGTVQTILDFEEDGYAEECVKLMVSGKLDEMAVIL